jgi:hypothetical protein
MEYIIGIAIGIASVIIVSSLRAKSIPMVGKLKLRSSQSRIYNQLRPAFEIMNMIKPSKPLVSQAAKHMQENSMRFLTMEDKAYWIKDNTVFVADISNGDLSSIGDVAANPVDMMSLDKEELDKMIFIVEKLTEGLANDSRNSGN